MAFLLCFFRSMKPLALISVSEKSGIVEFAQGLAKKGWEIVSTGGTLDLLQKNGLEVLSVEDLTGFPECFGGRVKTLHPMIAGGILFRRDHADDVKRAAELKIRPIDLVVVNLYPFAETISKPNVTREEAIEQIDIGGPTLLRAAAKNHHDVTVVCDPSDYSRVLDVLDQEKIVSELRKELATKVFLHTAHYDSFITYYLSGGTNDGLLLTKGKRLRYGENPHQTGMYYSYAGDEQEHWKVHQGKELSYLNLLDADGAWNTVVEFEDPTVVMVKHANPSGIASRSTIEEAFQASYDADRLSAFGVIIALNRPCTKEIVQKMIDQKMFVEILLAPVYDSDALELLKSKPNLRVLQMGDYNVPQRKILFRSALCGILMQDLDMKVITEKDLTVVTKKKPTEEQIQDLLFAWKCVKHSKSNAIVFVKDRVTVGIGAGQTSRVDATWIAAKRAGEKAKGAVMASDAFFPFPDSVEEAAKNGIAAIIQPGGSIRDEDVIKKADELGIAMVTTGVRAFWH
jgi:phosphoribosylaminoimidazolecarboxamide formyltransferase/IMP cyclohydrolase